MLTVGRLAARFSLSRSTLLYYDSIGLLCPSGRSSSNYRLYSAEDGERLALICRYREVGLSLEQIRAILDGGGDRAVVILDERLESLNEEIGRLRDQQRIVAKLLRGRARLRSTRAMDKNGWVALLRATGLGDQDMHDWHVEFERMAPEAHADFLASLGIDPAEIERIRAWARKDSSPGE